MTDNACYEPIVDGLLRPNLLAQEAADLADRPDFEMPYGRAWFLRLALEDRIVTGSSRLTLLARAVADSLVAHYRAMPPDPLSREYGNPCWAMINLLDYARSEGRADLVTFAQETTAAHILPALDRLPDAAQEDGWPDFMAVTANLCEILVRTGAAPVQTVLARAGERLRALTPVTEPRKPHHFALNFSRAWSMLALYEACSEEWLLQQYLDHMEVNLNHPSWWRGDYRAVAHWVPQFGMFALQRAMQQRAMQQRATRL
jgi:hypothetical protein